MFHVIAPDARTTYADSLAAMMRPGSRYFMLCISDQQTGAWGPHRLSRTDIETTFTDRWHIDSIAPARMRILPDLEGVHAWLAAIAWK